MKKIPFDIKYRPEIETGKYKVVTEFGEPARIICWDSKYHASLPIIALVDDGDGEDMIHFGADGKLSITGKLDGTILWIITDEPEELTEFEKRLAEILDYAMANPVDTSPQIAEQAKKLSPELLSIAQKELENSDWIKDIREWCYNKGHLEGYAKGQEDAEKRHREATSFHYDLYPPYPPCYVGGPCTNPHHDCINCPRPGTSGIAKTDTNIKQQ